MGTNIFVRSIFRLCSKFFFIFWTIEFSQKMGRFYEMKVFLSTLFLLILSCNAQDEEHSLETTQERDSKLSVFQVVKFANGICKGSSRNGTCYTAAECENIGGTKDGTCADGFGVCCIVILTTSGSSSVNNTYIYKASGTTYTTGDHKYTICPCSDNICRIRLDLNTFTIASPNTGFGTRYANGDAATYPIGTAQAIGDCWTDTFFVNSPYGRSTPVICGVNSGQHMYVDTTESECVDVHYGVGGGTSATRELDIRVSQFACGDEMGGPAGCLQYYTSSAGKIRSFNFPDLTPGAAVGYKYVHLSRQHYKACVRKATAKAYICYGMCTSIVGSATATIGSPVILQPSFGLSVSPAAGSQSAVGSACTSDYITIPSAVTKAIAAILSSNTVMIAETTSTATRFCGRYLATTAATYADTSICSLAVPFELAVDFNDDEFCSAKTSGKICEFYSGAGAALTGGGGILGFSLCYTQLAA